MPSLCDIPDKILLQYITVYCDNDTLYNLHRISKHYYNVLTMLLQQRINRSMELLDIDKNNNIVYNNGYQYGYDTTYEVYLQDGFDDAYKDIFYTQYTTCFNKAVDDIKQRIMIQYNIDIDNTNNSSTNCNSNHVTSHTNNNEFDNSIMSTWVFQINDNNNNHNDDNSIDTNNTTDFM